MNIVRIGACLALVAGLTGCGHNLYVVGRTTGIQGKTRIVTAGNHSGSISMDLGGKTYTGQWVYAPTGGAVGVGTTSGFVGGQPAMATSTVSAMPASGPGSVIASAPDGSSLRCTFTYSEWGATGMGVCQDNKGELYDLQIN